MKHLFRNFARHPLFIPGLIVGGAAAIVLASTKSASAAAANTLPFPHEEVDRSIGTETPPSGVITVPGYKIIADINADEAKSLLEGGITYDAFDQIIRGSDGNPLVGPMPRTVPIAWFGIEGDGSNPGSVVWLSKDRKRAVVAWNASTPAIIGPNIPFIPDNQLVWTEVGQNYLTDAVRKSWK